MGEVHDMGCASTSTTQLALQESYQGSESSTTEEVHFQPAEGN